MKTFFLQQDAAEKITVTINENELRRHLKKHFKWRKNLTIGRLNTLGTAQRDAFIKYCSTAN